MDLESANFEIERLNSLLFEFKKENQRLREENQKLREEIEYRNNDENDMCSIIREMKNELNELKQRVENIENASQEYDDEVYPEADNEDDAEWFPLKGFEDDYEIKNIYPYYIRRKRDGKIVKECDDKQSGYIKLGLNSKPYQKHILIAKQFIPNDDPINKKIVDHKNHRRNDYHISNLRWISPKDNNRNKQGRNGIVYEYVDTISDDSIKVDSYGNHTFDNYYFYNNAFYFYTGINYRKLHINEDKYGNKSVRLITEEGKNITVYYNKFKREHDIYD